METLQKIVRRLSTKPGVYQFLDKAGTIIYVGKAVNIKKRVSQYFHVSSQKQEKTKQLVSRITDIRTIETISEFDALFLEARLIKTNLPKYNMIARDDKRPIYIAIHGENLPYVSLSRQPKDEGGRVFGPFQSSHAARFVLRSVRRVIPFCTQKQRTGKPCFYTNLSLCRHCPSEISGIYDSKRKRAEEHAYKGQVRALIRLLSGKSVLVRKQLYEAMQTASQNTQFEKARELRDAIFNLDRMRSTHFDPSWYEDNAVSKPAMNEVADLRNLLLPFFPSLPSLSRIECIDISHLSGSNPTGSLVVMTNGMIDTSKYRRFKIQFKGPNDTEMIYHVMLRRLRHISWPYPDLFIIDGGTPQVKAAEKSISEMNLSIPTIGLAKRYETIVLRTNNTTKHLRVPLTKPSMHLLLRIRDEAHRFAKQYHLYRRTSSFLV